MNHLFCAELKSNSAVLTAFRRLGDVLTLMKGPTSEIFSYKDVLKCSNLTIVTPTIYSTIIVSLLNYALKRNNEVIFWVQGVAPEESYLKHKNKIKYFILLYMEKLALKMSGKHIFVSSYMQEHYQKKYNLHTPSYIFPCTSDLKISHRENKIKESYCYLGGISSWQRFDKIVEIGYEVLQTNPKATFYIATKEANSAKELIRTAGYNVEDPRVKIVSLTSKAEVEDFLSKMEYGFLIRDNCLVNHVSSPIKLAEYLSMGVNVIMTDAIKSYVSIIEQYKCGCVVTEGSHIVHPNSYNFDGAVKAFNEHFSFESILKNNS